MKNLIDKLREVMNGKSLSPENALIYINCSCRTVYNWLKDEAIPSERSKKTIRKGIIKMKRMMSVVREKRDERPKRCRRTYWK